MYLLLPAAVSTASMQQPLQLSGLLFTDAKMDVVYGGGGIGLMGKLADAVIENGGRITGVIPSFMKDEGWDHSDVSEMIVTPGIWQKEKNKCLQWQMLLLHCLEGLAHLKN